VEVVESRRQESDIGDYVGGVLKTSREIEALGGSALLGGTALDISAIAKSLVWLRDEA